MVFALMTTLQHPQLPDGTKLLPVPEHHMGPAEVIGRITTSERGLAFGLTNATGSAFDVYYLDFWATHVVTVTSLDGQRLPTGPDWTAMQRAFQNQHIRDGTLRFGLRPGETFRQDVPLNWTRSVQWRDGWYRLQITWLDVYSRWTQPVTAEAIIEYRKGAVRIAPAPNTGVSRPKPSG